MHIIIRIANTKKSAHQGELVVCKNRTSPVMLTVANTQAMILLRNLVILITSHYELEVSAL